MLTHRPRQLGICFAFLGVLMSACLGGQLPKSEAPREEPSNPGARSLQDQENRREYVEKYETYLSQTYVHELFDQTETLAVQFPHSPEFWTILMERKLDCAMAFEKIRRESSQVFAVSALNIVERYVLSAEEYAVFIANEEDIAKFRDELNAIQERMLDCTLTADNDKDALHACRVEAANGIKSAELKY